MRSSSRLVPSCRDLFSTPAQGGREKDNRSVRYGIRWCCLAFLLLSGCALNAIKPPTPSSTLNLDLNEPPPPGEHYYVLIWGSQRVFRTPSYSHTFVTVVHT